MIEKNKIYLGDSYKLIKQIPDKSIDCIYVDIPYFYGGTTNNLVDLEETNVEKSALSKRINKIQQKEIRDIVNGIDYSIFQEYERIMKKVNLYIWCSKLQIMDILNYWGEKENIYFEILVWTKTNPTPMAYNSWLPDIEYCLYFREKGVILNDGYEHKSKWYSSSINKRDKDWYNHPTIKPLDFVKNHILHTTQEGDIVLDTFLGSGTTAVACKELGRNYIGFEINENYYKIATDRLNGITQQEIREKEDGILNIFDFLEE